MAKEKSAHAAAAEPVPAAPEDQSLAKFEGSQELQEGSLSDLLLEDSESNAGFANMGANDFAIPFLAILQKGSPQVDKLNAKCIRGSEPGMVYNTVTQEVYPGDVGILYIPCGYSKLMVEWKSRDVGGGLVASHKETDPFLKHCTRNDRGQLVVPESGNIVIDTAYHFGLLVHDEAPVEWAVVSMYATQLKKSRMWNTTMRRILLDGPKGKFNPAPYSHYYRMTTIGEAKDNYSWYGWKVVTEGRVQDLALYKVARAFSQQVEAGSVRVSAPPQEFDEVEDPEKVPF